MMTNAHTSPATMTAKQFAAVLAQYHATAVIEDTSRAVDLVVEAPDGFRWMEGLQHALRASEYVDAMQTYAKALGVLRQDAADRMAFGLEACPADCDCKIDIEDADVR